MNQPTPSDPLEPRRIDLCLVADSVLNCASKGVPCQQFPSHAVNEAVIFLKRLGVWKDVSVMKLKGGTD